MTESLKNATTVSTKKFTVFHLMVMVAAMATTFGNGHMI